MPYRSKSEKPQGGADSDYRANYVKSWAILYRWWKWIKPEYSAIGQEFRASARTFPIGAES
jgi:hypothetical protein